MMGGGGGGREGVCDRDRIAVRPNTAMNGLIERLGPTYAHTLRLVRQY